jgi:predicted glycosyltransferase
LLTRRVRIAFYSHDTMGLGHMRRNLLLAEPLAACELRPDVLLVAGSRDVNRFAFPPGVDCLSLPALYKDEGACYHARHWDAPLSDVTAVRSAAILGAVDAFAPDVFIVDNVPRGAARELDPVLAHLRRGGRTRCVLGLRDILDAPEAVRSEWQCARNEEAIRAWYDVIWVYGDQSVYDVAAEYQLPPDIAPMIRYTGYLDQRARLESAVAPTDDPLAELVGTQAPVALCTVGGGQDGSHVAEAFAEAPLPAGMEGVVITGPMMPGATLERLRASAHARAGRLRVLPFHPEPAHVLRRADHVVAMGGYNSVCEILSFRKRALVVPRVRPRVEQLIRAQRMRDLGLLDVLHPDELTPEAIGAWLARPASVAPAARPVGLHSRQRLQTLLDEVLAIPVRGLAGTQSVLEARRAG